jgi:hypothetical protein
MIRYVKEMTNLSLMVITQAFYIDLSSEGAF